MRLAAGLARLRILAAHRRPAAAAPVRCSRLAVGSGAGRGQLHGSGSHRTFEGHVERGEGAVKRDAGGAARELSLARGMGGGSCRRVAGRPGHLEKSSGEPGGGREGR